MDIDIDDATTQITAALDDEARKICRDAITIWNTESIKRVMEAASGRSDIDAKRDQRGKLEGRQNNHLEELAQSFTEPQWNESENQFEFTVTHAAAAFHEFGARPHEIRAKEARALVFEWPDMPEEVREKYEKQWARTTNMLEEPQVALNSVEHPGIPAIGYIRHGRQQARRRLKDAGFSVKRYGYDEEGGDE